MSAQQGDPRWIRARYRGVCAQCPREVKPGDACFYYPLTRKVLCAGDTCGGQASRQFEAAASDEAAATGASW